MRKQPTAEQKQKAKERREQFRKLAKQVSEMSDEQKAHLTARLGAVPTCDGRTLSLHNTCLLLTQCPGVSLVGGFRQWLKLGRSVKKGEHGHCIWIPLGASKSADNSGEPTSVDDPRFGVGTVFDVSQTRELPAQEEQPFDVIEALNGIGKISLAAARRFDSTFRPDWYNRCLFARSTGIALDDALSQLHAAGCFLNIASESDLLEAITRAASVRRAERRRQLVANQ